MKLLQSCTKPSIYLGLMILPVDTTIPVPLTTGSHRADSRFAPSQWETSLQSNAVSHLPGANLEQSLSRCVYLIRSHVEGTNEYQGWDDQCNFFCPVLFHCTGQLLIDTFACRHTRHGETGYRTSASPAGCTYAYMCIIFATFSPVMTTNLGDLSRGVVISVLITTWALFLRYTR